jgi:hypothetical protein
MSTQFEFRVANNTISKIIPEVCEAIYQALGPEFFTVSYASTLYLHSYWTFFNQINSI